MKTLLPVHKDREVNIFEFPINFKFEDNPKNFFGVTRIRDNVPYEIIINTRFPRWRQVLAIFHEIYHVYENSKRYRGKVEKLDHTLLHHYAIGSLLDWKFGLKPGEFEMLFKEKLEPNHGIFSYITDIGNFIIRGKS